MARLFHALVVAGAAVSACAGKSTSSDGDEAGAGGSAGTTGGDAGSANGGTATGGSLYTGGVSPTGGAASTGGTAGVAGLPEPGSRAQWNCEGLVDGRVCVNVLGTTATPIPDTCPVELREYWVDRARGELTTALTFEFMLNDLVLEGVPDELFALARTAIADEHRHVDWCLRWARLVDPERPAEPELSGTRPLELEGASAHDNRLLRTVFGCCFSETVAIHVLRRSHALITLPSVRRLNQEHMKEEVGHARLGWALVAWPGLSSRDRSMLAAHAPEMLRLVRMVWQLTERSPDARLHELGFLSSAIVGPACDEAIDEVVLPGLEQALGASLPA